ncbi:MAG TPA: GNAT family N-acetyltransferase [Trebonia sp.]|jgi:ribosomal protein S18 acetylase RimI-like enzyme|nr:GNAT family N-acetyltransferase [Trebonia sp.]
MTSYEWRGGFSNRELEALHAEGFGHAITGFDWQECLHGHSLGWVCARLDGGPGSASGSEPGSEPGAGPGSELVGFVNVAWDGGSHAFILDTVVAGRARRAGIGTELVALAARHAGEAGCEWLHVDFGDHLVGFYHNSCGFAPTRAGLIRLAGPGTGTR